MKFIYVLLINAGLTVVIPVILIFFPAGLDNFQKLQIGILIWIALLISECLYYLRKLLKEKQRTETVWTVKNDFDAIIKQIRDNCERVINSGLSDHDRLFEDLLMRDLITLANSARSAADENELAVEDHHFKSHDALAEIFKDSDTTIFRELYLLDEASGSFDYVYINFLKMLEKVSKKQGINVRTLFIRSETSEFESSETIQVLLNYYHFRKNFDKRVLEKKKLENLKAEYRVGTNWTDFGIYGNQLIFKTMAYGRNSTEGVFFRNQREIENCRSFFDKAWSEAEAFDPANPRKVKIKDLEKLVQ